MEPIPARGCVLREGLIDYLSPDFLVGECVLQRCQKITVLRPFVITRADDQERLRGCNDDVLMVFGPLIIRCDSWYQGDIETNRFRVGFGSFIGRFSIETFIVAPLAALFERMPPGVAPRHRPLTKIPHLEDASSSPPTFPVHTYHLGLWFNSPQDVQKAGLPPAVTPFNGEHNAGVQVLNTSNFPDLEGHLSTSDKEGRALPLISAKEVPLVRP